MVGLAELEREIAKFNPQADYSLLRRAYDFAYEHHKDQLRASKEPYFTHLLATAKTLIRLHLDEETIAAALLHDIIEDTPVEIDEIVQTFNPEIAALVEGVTKLSGLQFKTSEEHVAENLRKMFMAMARDVRVLLIKLADRLHNMRTLKYLSEEKQKRISKETLEIYAPLANRLGIGVIKIELENLCLRYLDPEAYEMIEEATKKVRLEHSDDINRYVDPLQKQLKVMHIKGEISGRPKHIYSIYQKMKRKNVDINKIYDLIAMRVITDDIKDCYGALGIIHSFWTPMPGRFKDYIAVPKPNMYQSLHTTVFGASGEPIEFQIRTRDMHSIAEEGIAAHWWYKEKDKGKKILSEVDKFAWLKHLLQLEDPHEFMESLKIDLYEDQVFVFTPTGDVKELPRGSTAVDFAYAIHSAIGDTCVGAKVNDRIVPLRYTLINGDIVSVITSKNGKPNRDWLRFVKTSKARSRIRGFIRKTERSTCIQIGRNMLETELKKRGLNPKEYLQNKKLEEAALQLNVADPDDLFAEIGFNQIPPIRVARLLSPEPDTTTIKTGGRETKSVHKTGIRVDGLDGDVVLALARCCSPVRGDSIIGLITRGRGISVHRASCPNTINFDQRDLIEVEWYSEKEKSGSYEVSLEAEAYDRSNLLADILKAITDDKITINSASAWRTKNLMAKCRFLIKIKDLEEMEGILKKIRKVESVISANRCNPL